MKKQLLLIVALICVAVVHAANGDTFEYNGLKYAVISEENHEVMVSENPDISGAIEIPSYAVNGSSRYFVTMIGDHAFEDCKGLTSVTIPNSVTVISYDAFEDCSGLTSVTIPNSVTEIGMSAFSGCSGLTSVTIPNSVTKIGYYAFQGCSGLTSVTIPNSVTVINQRTFEGCRGLTSVTIPNSVTEIDFNAFKGCSGLTSVTIPNSVTKIGHNAFENCRGLTSVTISNSLTEIGECIFQGCSGLTSVTIPNSVTSIDSYAFKNCNGLTSVTFPNSLTSISFNAFEGCSGLTSVTIPNSVSFISNGAFVGCINLAEIIVEDGNKKYVSLDGVLYNIDKTMLVLCPEAKTSVTIPNSVTSIDSRAFKGCSGLTSVTIPNSVTVIYNGAFQSCSGLTSVTIPNSVTKIGDSVFEDCSGLTSVTIPNSVTEIGSYVFNGCSGLESVVISANIVNIPYRAFSGCSKLTKIYNLNPTPQTLKSDSFEEVPSDAIVYIPKGSFKLYFVADGWTYFTDFREMGAFDITMSNEAVELAVGETVILKAEVTTDDDMSIQSSEWSTSNPAVATIDEDGIVTAVAPGEAVIYFTATDNYGVPHTESCKVTVIDNSAVENIAADSNAPVEVYNLNGIRVATSTDNLPAGLYIIHQGNVTKKVIVK